MTPKEREMVKAALDLDKGQRSMLGIVHEGGDPFRPTCGINAETCAALYVRGLIRPEQDHFSAGYVVTDRGHELSEFIKMVTA